MRKFIPVGGLMLMMATPVLAQSATAPAGTPTATAPAAAVSVSAGQTVYDTAGDEVGKVSKVEGGNVVIATGQHDVALPLTSFATSDKGPVIALTKDQLNTAASGAAATASAKTAAAVTAGTAVKDTSGAAVGTIKSVEGEYALLDTSKVQVRLPVASFVAKDDGLVIGMTKAQLEAAASAAAPATK